ncbi:hypothetical protein [Alkalimonas amylolytica]|uniref:Uncharacterized protein n=1 Tax=Alkalimonas amylolytica TaxID=152573 RepID=A0A1H3ZSJ8_ALKAM|nr:hypothetical protein [Alkalimonas amylolytica]SEA26679.1 hypothetical protein SAMN04488051_102340 [Alkalimonas amylolytica]
MPAKPGKEPGQAADKASSAKRLRPTAPDVKVPARIRRWLYRLLLLGVVLIAVLFFFEAVMGIVRDSF